MKTLYELLGALPHDDAESLRAAFRKAVKGAHPDLRPGDPDAALKFRQILRANEILGDAKQRAVYDNLLELAAQEQSTASRHDMRAGGPKLVSALVALFGASVGTVGFLLLMHMSVASIASGNNSEIGAGHSARSPDPYDDIIPPGAKGANLDTNVAWRRQTAESVSVMADIRADKLVMSETKSLGAGEISNSGHDDFNGRIAYLGETNQISLPSYIDHRIIFFRHQKNHGFVDTAPRTKRPSRAKTVPIITAPRIRPAALATLPRGRTAAKDLPRESFAAMAR